jgi:hypothetical protein
MSVRDFYLRCLAIGWLLGMVASCALSARVMP